jgi:integrase
MVVAPIEARAPTRFGPDADEAHFLAKAPQRLHLPLLLALWTGQRQGDLLRLAWSAYSGTHIRLRQSKTGRRVVIRVGAPLKAALDAAAKIKTGPVVLHSSAGRPWRLSRSLAPS